MHETPNPGFWGFFSWETYFIRLSSAELMVESSKFSDGKHLRVFRHKGLQLQACGINNVMYFFGEP